MADSELVLVEPPVRGMAIPEELIDVTKAYLIEARAKSTREVYARQWASFTTWCDVRLKRPGRSRSKRLILRMPMPSTSTNLPTSNLRLASGSSSVRVSIPPERRQPNGTFRLRQRFPLNPDEDLPEARVTEHQHCRTA